MTDRGQGLSFNTIVLAVIALLVLASIVFIFTSKAREGNQGLSICNGYCLTTADGGQCNEGFVKIPMRNCDAGKKETPF